MNEHELARFALTVWEAAPSVEALDNRSGYNLDSLFQKYMLEYNKRVTQPMTWPQFRDALMQSWEKGWIQFQGGVGISGKWASWPTIAGAKDDYIHIKSYDEIPTSIAEQILGKGRTKMRQRGGFYYRKLADGADRTERIKAVRKFLKEDFLDDVNEELMDAMIRNQIYLMRLTGDIRKKTEALLNATERDIAEKVRKTLFKFNLTQSEKQARFLQRYIHQIRGKNWEDINEMWAEEMKQLAASEPKRLAGIVNTISPTVISLELPATDFAEALVKTDPFQGRVLKDWADDIARADILRMTDQIRIGMIQGETGDQIARRIVGTAARGGADGVTEITRRNAQAIIRTAVNHFGHAARDQFFSNNSDVFPLERYVATLDSRTTPICRSLDGRISAYGKGPKSPQHWNCRSIVVPMINGEIIGSRPLKASTEKGMLRDFADEQGLRRVAKRANLPRGYKGQFDEYKRARVRALTMRVPAAMNYQTFLERQSREFQDDVLGPTRAKLFRRGGLTLDRFVDRAGSELNLRELAKKHADAFRAAGLDPQDFL